VQADINARDKTLGEFRDLLKELQDRVDKEPAKRKPVPEKKDAPGQPEPKAKTGAVLT